MNRRNTLPKILKLHKRTKQIPELRNTTDELEIERPTPKRELGSSKTEI